MSPTDEEHAAFKRSEYERIKPAFLSEPPSHEALAEALRRATRQLHGEGADHRAGSWVYCPNRWCSTARQVLHESAALASSGSAGEMP
jgi:hypothetical protein